MGINGLVCHHEFRVGLTFTLKDGTTFSWSIQFARTLRAPCVLLARTVFFLFAFPLSASHAGHKFKRRKMKQHVTCDKSKEKL